MAYSNLRIGGLASGIDIDQIISDLMKVERTKVDKLYQQKKILEWQKEDYRNINLKLKSLYDFVFNMKLQGTYLKYKTTGTLSSGQSADTYFTASAGASAIPGEYKVSVVSLAESAKLESGSPISVTYKQIDPSKSIKDQRDYFANDPFGGNDTLSEFKFTITANGKSKTFIFKTTDSLNYILSTISSDSTINVSAYYDPITDKVVFKTKDTGASTSISIINENGGGNLFGETGAFKISGSGTGKNAVVKISDIDGTNEITIEKTSNTFTIGGITFNLRKEMAPGESAILKVERDIDGVVDTIKKFVELYNETIDYINKELSEQRYRDYLPLTEEQKKEMKEDEIKLWEEKARSGLLRSDQLVMSIRDKMREILYTPVKGLPAEFDSLLDIGIKTGSYYEKGKLYLDEAKLREALSKDPEAVMRLFTNAGDSSTGKGIAVSLYDVLKAGIKSITDKAGGGDFEVFDNSFLARRIREVDDKIKVMEEKLKEIEDRYWRQFTEMEKAIAAMNQQSMWLANQLGLYSSNS
ncbi:Flagellar hook-associated protein 2 [Fervidicola ferrireducens]|uniref:Flagellar hook-associated protein 2 n=1 Tax=Fervidicola ferrireducens TaxID=520764 RepID=A0A140LE00_9FIRM|nr:flagellar filament capping protein FliD [Fervidicola ferrireducens]KXG78775.1 Flagellar hook-associated protein 2 [Fervidicola ferrireducens]